MAEHLGEQDIPVLIHWDSLGICSDNLNYRAVIARGSGAEVQFSGSGIHENCPQSWLVGPDGLFLNKVVWEGAVSGKEPYFTVFKIAPLFIFAH